MKNIEIMAYYYTYDDNDKYGLVPILYSNVDKNGFVKIARKKPLIESTFSFSEIDESLLIKVISETENKSEKDFEIKFDPTSIKLDCGPIVRFKITSTNGKELSFLIDYNSDSNKKFSDFSKLYRQISSDTLTELKNKNEINKLLDKQENFKKFSYKKDSINLPPPPGPKPIIDEVKFKK